MTQGIFYKVVDKHETDDCFTSNYLPEVSSNQWRPVDIKYSLGRETVYPKMRIYPLETIHTRMYGPHEAHVATVVPVNPVLNSATGWWETDSFVVNGIERFADFKQRNQPILEKLDLSI